MVWLSPIAWLKDTGKYLNEVCQERGHWWWSTRWCRPLFLGCCPCLCLHHPQWSGLVVGIESQTHQPEHHCWIFLRGATVLLLFLAIIYFIKRSNILQQRRRRRGRRRREHRFSWSRLWSENRDLSGKALTSEGETCTWIFIFYIIWISKDNNKILYIL